MKMFLTRLGFGAKMIVTGDITQIDLPRGERSGLVNVREVLASIPDIAFVYFDSQDVVRHKLVQDIVSAYKEHSDAVNPRTSRPAHGPAGTRPRCARRRAGGVACRRLDKHKERSHWRERLAEFAESVEKRDSRRFEFVMMAVLSSGSPYSSPRPTCLPCTASLPVTSPRGP